MPAHLKRRGSTWYLIDGATRKSLNTDKKGIANYRLEQYVKGKFGLGPKVTVKEYYDTWIETKKPPMVRKSCEADYRQHFTRYVLVHFSDVTLQSVSLKSLQTLRSLMLTSTEEHAGLSLKTCRNIIDGSFRAMWRDALREGVVSHNPFELLDWPRIPRQRPDPFTAQERDVIVAHFAEKNFFYYPWVFVQFSLGMRPSEASALRWTDVDMEAGTISISKSRDMGSESATKTKGSDRIICMLNEEVREALKILPSRAMGSGFVFLNKFGDPVTKKWAAHNWADTLKALGIRHRKFYATRHTFITERIKAGENPLAVAQHCGTSLAMIQQDYCGRLGLKSNLNRSDSTLDAANLLGNGLTEPGSAPVAGKSRRDLQRLAQQGFDAWKKAKSA